MSDRNAGEFLPAIRRARFERLTIYEITDTELQLLERGSAESLLLTFAIFLLSTAISFLITLLTTPIASDRLFTVFVVIVTVGFIAGIVLFALWFWHSASRSTLIQDIKKRMPPEGESVPLQTLPTGFDEIGRDRDPGHGPTPS